MTIYPVDVFDVCCALEQMLNDDSALADLPATVVNGEAVNEDPGLCPWLGIYRTGVVLGSRAIGVGSGYRTNNVGLVIVTQEQSTESGRDCSRKLEILNQHVLRVLLNDESLKGFVDTLDETVEVVYQSYGLEQGAYMQTSLIQFVGVRRVSAR